MKKKKVSKKTGIIRIRKQKVKIEPPEAPIEKPIEKPVTPNIILAPSAEAVKEVEKTFKEERKEINSEKIRLPDSPEHHHESNALKIVGIVLCSLVMLFWITLAILSLEYNPGPRMIEKNVSVTSFEMTTASFDRFQNITDVKYNEKIDQIGYLYQEINDKGITKKYLVDDRGRKIELMLRGITQGEKYDSLFVMDEISKQLYNVTGIYRFEMNKYIIEVDDIVTAEKKTTEYTQWQVINMTTDDVKGMTFNIVRGVNKIVSFNYT